MIEPGDYILLKPNLIYESHSSRPNEWEQVITHPSIIRAVLDYVFIVLKSKSRVTIADGPQTDSDFDEAIERTSQGKLRFVISKIPSAQIQNFEGKNS